MSSVRINAEFNKRSIQTEGPEERRLETLEINYTLDAVSPRDQNQKQYDSFFSLRDGSPSPINKRSFGGFMTSPRAAAKNHSVPTTEIFLSTELDPISNVKSPRNSDLESKLNIVLGENAKLNEAMNKMIEEKIKQQEHEQELTKIVAFMNERYENKYQKAIEELTEKINELHLDNEVLMQEVIKRGSSNFMPRDDHRTLVDQKEKKIHELSDQILQKDIDMAQLRFKLENREKEVEQILAKLKEKDSLIQKAQAQIKEKNLQLQDKQKALTEKQKIITDLYRQNEDNRTEKFTKELFDKALKNKDNEIARLNSQLTETRKQLEESQKDLEVMKAEKLAKEKLDQELKKKEEEISKLKKKEKSVLKKLKSSESILESLTEEHENLKNAFKVASLTNLDLERKSADTEKFVVKAKADNVFRVIKTLKKVAARFKELLIRSKRRKHCEMNQIDEIDQISIAHENFKGKFDVVFCVDCTNSMGPYINEVKHACSYIMEEMKRGIARIMEPDLRFAFVGYRDYGRMNGWVTKIQDLTEANLCADFISGITAMSAPGNDIPEAVIPGLVDCATKVKWRDNLNEKVLRFVFHIGDAPPHGKNYFNNS